MNYIAFWIADSLNIVSAPELDQIEAKDPEFGDESDMNLPEHMDDIFLYDC